MTAVPAGRTVIFLWFSVMGLMAAILCFIRGGGDVSPRKYGLLSMRFLYGCAIISSGEFVNVLWIL